MAFEKAGELKGIGNAYLLGDLFDGHAGGAQEKGCVLGPTIGHPFCGSFVEPQAK